MAMGSAVRSPSPPRVSVEIDVKSIAADKETWLAMDATTRNQFYYAMTFPVLVWPVSILLLVTIGPLVVHSVTGQKATPNWNVWNDFYIITTMTLSCTVDLAVTYSSATFWWSMLEPKTEHAGGPSCKWHDRIQQENQMALETFRQAHVCIWLSLVGPYGRC